MDRFEGEERRVCSSVESGASTKERREFTSVSRGRSLACGSNTHALGGRAGGALAAISSADGSRNSKLQSECVEEVNQGKQGASLGRQCIGIREAGRIFGSCNMKSQALTHKPR